MDEDNAKSNVKANRDVESTIASLSDIVFAPLISSKICFSILDTGTLLFCERPTLEKLDFIQFNSFSFLLVVIRVDEDTPGNSNPANCRSKRDSIDKAITRHETCDERNVW